MIRNIPKVPPVKHQTIKPKDICPVVFPLLREKIQKSITPLRHLLQIQIPYDNEISGIYKNNISLFRLNSFFGSFGISVIFGV